MRQQVGEGLEHFAPYPDALAGSTQHVALRVGIHLKRDTI
jgi:hypothetical protein